MNKGGLVKSLTGGHIIAARHQIIIIIIKDWREIESLTKGKRPAQASSWSLKKLDIIYLVHCCCLFVEGAGGTDALVASSSRLIYSPAAQVV